MVNEHYFVGIPELLVGYQGGSVTQYDLADVMKMHRNWVITSGFG